MMNRAYYSGSIESFLDTDPKTIVGCLASASGFSLLSTQTNAWLQQIQILKSALESVEGDIYFEYSIPRMGKRIDAVLLIGSVIFVLEFKIGAREYLAGDIDQVWDYALDLKNFHETSHGCVIAPILVATEAGRIERPSSVPSQQDGVLFPARVNREQLRSVIIETARLYGGSVIDPRQWETGRYSPTPTIIEAAIALCRGHTVDEISRNDATATNLSKTSEEIAAIIEDSRAHSRKSI